MKKILLVLLVLIILVGGYFAWKWYAVQYLLQIPNKILPKPAETINYQLPEDYEPITDLGGRILSIPENAVGNNSFGDVSISDLDFSEIENSIKSINTQN